MDDRIIFDEGPVEPSGSPLGPLVGVAVVALAIAVVALRPADVNPNSLSASPPTTLFVPPEAMTTTTTDAALVRATGSSLGDVVPGLRGAIHLEVATAAPTNQETSAELWIWNAAFADPIRVAVPGPIDISANRRNALAISWNQADEGVLWLGPKADVQPAQILPNLTQAMWSRTDTRQLVTSQVFGDTTTFTVWQFSGADSDIVDVVEVEGRWNLAHFSGDHIGMTLSGTSATEPRARMWDWVRNESVVDVPGAMVAGTTGPPVIAQCADAACVTATFRLLIDGALVTAPGQGWPIPSTNGPYVAVFEWEDTTRRTVIYDQSDEPVMEVPSHGFVGAWSGDGRFFVYPKTEAGFGDVPALVFIDTLERTHREVVIAADGDWFVTRIWYGS